MGEVKSSSSSESDCITSARGQVLSSLSINVEKGGKKECYCFTGFKLADFSKKKKQKPTRTFKVKL